MKKLILIIILGLFIVVLGCEKDQDVLEVQDETTSVMPQDVLSQDYTGEVAPVKNYVLPRPINNFRATDCTDPLFPDEFIATMYPGESRVEEKTICIPPIPPKADILYSFDLTGSMGGEITQVKNNCTNLANYIKGCIPEAYAGVVSHRDYPDAYTSCSYSATYGGVGESPYNLVQPLVDDCSIVGAAINALPGASGGSDGPESYSRVFYESYSDAAIGWRDNSIKFIVAWLDNVPHDCNLPLGIGTRGVDPGRNGDVDGLTYDNDLPIIDVLNNMDANDRYLIVIYSGSWPEDSDVYWDLWEKYATDYEKVSAFRINPDGTIPGGVEIGQFIVNAIEAAYPPVPSVKLMVDDPAYASWVTFDPGIINNDPIGGTFYSNVTFTVPEGAVPGEYSFKIVMTDEDGLYEYDYQDVIITVAAPVDIKPTSCRNPINIKSGGVVSVAINGTEFFDVTLVDPESVVLEGVPALRWNLEDVSTPYEPYWGKEDAFDCTDEGPDGYIDLVFKFDKKKLVEALGDPEDGEVMTLILNGETFEGQTIIGQDVVVILKKGKK